MTDTHDKGCERLAVELSRARADVPRERRDIEAAVRNVLAAYKPLRGLVELARLVETECAVGIRGMSLKPYARRALKEWTDG